MIGQNLNAPTQMIAARIADNIMGQTQLAAELPAYNYQPM